MFNLKISIDTYTAGTWRNLDKSGEIEVSAIVDCLSEGYEKLKTQVNELLAQANAENKLILDLNEAQKEIQSKEKTLRDLENEITRITAQINRLNSFLERLGINPRDDVLEISNSRLDVASTDNESGEIVAVEAEVDPIPFNSATDEPSHEF